MDKALLLHGWGGNSLENWLSFNKTSGVLELEEILEYLEK